MSRLEELVGARIALGNLVLPVFPSSARELLGKCEEPDVDVKALADVIRRDATLAGHFLALTNSAAFSARSPVVTLQQALTRLGLVQTKQIALMIACKTRAFAMPDRRERAAELLSHAFATALHAQEIARVRRFNVEEAFLVGLLHDIGEPAVLQLCASLQRELGTTFDRAEIDACVARFHERVGGVIAANWSMRATVVEAIAGHHAAPERAMTALVQLADILAQGEREVVGHAANEVLNLYPEDIERIVAKVSGLLVTEKEAA